MTTLVSVVDGAIRWDAVTIANPNTESAEIDLQGRMLCGIKCDADITATAITFKDSRTSGGTFTTVYKQDGTALEVTINGTATGTYAIAPADAASLRFIKVVLGTTPASGSETVYVGSRVL